MHIIAFDEAGNTGGNLLDPVQPVFTLASVLAFPEVNALVPRDSVELKFASLRRSEAGRKKVLQILNSDVLSPDKFVISGFHKRFMAVTKIVDLLYEPLARLGGIDLYERGANIAMSNLLYNTLPVFVGRDKFEDILTGFVGMIREPSNDNMQAFYLAVEQAYHAADEDNLQAELGALLATAPIAKAHQPDFNPSDLDPAIPGFFQHASTWTKRLKAPFRVIHDESKPIYNEQLVLEAMMSLSEEPQEVGYDRRKMHFPISAAGIEFAKSQDVPALQIADLIAGSTAYVMRTSLTGTTDPFAEQLLETKVLNGTWMPVWPTMKVTPEELETEEGAPETDPSDLIGDYVSRKLGGIPPVGARRKPTMHKDKEDRGV